MDTAAELGIAYQARTLDAPLQDALGTAGAVVIEGPRACGKTMTALNAAASFGRQAGQWIGEDVTVWPAASRPAPTCCSNEA